jgi:hypothetical protein
MYKRFPEDEATCVKHIEEEVEFNILINKGEIFWFILHV